MKLVLLLCKSRYRKKNLNNFCKSQFLGKYFILKFSDIFFFIGLFLSKLKIFKTISIDSNPIIDEKNGFNFWLTGTKHKIPNEYKSLKNNFVNMKSVFHNEDNIFQLYPIIKKEIIKKQNIKIVNISSYEIKRSNLSDNIWNKYKNDIQKDLTFIDNKNIWISKNLEKNHLNNFLIYRDLKINLRLLIVKKIFNEFGENFFLFGDTWKKYFKKSHGNVEKKSQIEKIYCGNICLDFGSTSGSLTLYPRSIDIIENGGYLMQLKQSDSHKIFGEYEEYFTYTNLNDLSKKVNEIFNNRELFFERLKILNGLFQNSKILMEKQLNNIL